MPEPLPAEEVAARLAETLALCGWEGVRVENVADPETQVPALRFTARPLGPVQPVASPYGAASSLTGARQRVRDQTIVLSAVLAQQQREQRAEIAEREARVERLEAAAGDIPGEVEESAGSGRWPGDDGWDESPA